MYWWDGTMEIFRRDEQFSQEFSAEDVSGGWILSEKDDINYFFKVMI